MRAYLSFDKMKNVKNVWRMSLYVSTFSIINKFFGFSSVYFGQADVHLTEGSSDHCSSLQYGAIPM